MCVPLPRYAAPMRYMKRNMHPLKALVLSEVVIIMLFLLSVVAPICFGSFYVADLFC